MYQAQNGVKCHHRYFDASVTFHFVAISTLRGFSEESEIDLPPKPKERSTR